MALFLLIGCGRVSFDGHTVGDGHTPGDAGIGCPGNVVTDPGFEQGAATWSGDSDGMFTRITDAYAGSLAGRTCRTTSGSTAAFAVRGRETLPDFSVGASYHVTAFMRATMSPTGGVWVRFYMAGGEIAQVRLPVDLTPTWTQITADFTVPAAAAGATSILLDFAAYNAPPDPAYCVDVDEVCLVAQ